MNMNIPSFSARRSILLTSIALLSPFLVVPANAGVVWDGGGADDNWGTGANWSPDGSPAPGATVDLTFDGTTRLTPLNNYTAFNDFRSLFFAATAGQFNVGGDAIDIFGKIENYSALTQTVSLASLAINAGQAGTGEFNPVNGDLVINSANVFTNGNALHIYGSNNRTVTFGAGSVISQGGSFAIEQANTVIFQSAHTYTGDTLVNAGTLAFAAGGSVNGSVLRLGGTAVNSGAATVSLTAVAGGQTLASTLVVRPSASGTQGARTIASQNTSGTNTLSGGVFLDADLTTSATAGGALAFTGGAFDLKNQTLAVGGAGNTSISGVLQNSTGSGKLTKTGNGTLTLGGANSFSGALTVAEGTLSTANWNNNSTNGPLGNSTLPVTLGGATTQGTLRFTGGGSNNVPTTIKPLSLAAGGGKVEMVYATGDRGGNYIHINGDRITGSGGLTVDTFVGGATSRFIVVGSAPYTGPTVVAAGSELQTNYDVAGDGTPFGAGANGLGSAVTVNAGGLLTFFSFNNTRTIALGSLAGAGTVQGEGGGTHTFKIGGDNTSTTFTGIFQNNGGPVAVTKVGTGTLTLSGASTHTGATAVNKGGIALTGTLNGTSISVNDPAASFTESGTGAIAGAGVTFTLNSGTATLAGANTFTGLPMLNGGAISVPTWNLSGAAGPWGAVANNTGAPATTFIQMNGGRINYTGSSATGNLRGVNLASGNNTIDIIAGSTLNFAGGGFNTFQSNGGNLIKEGGGTLQIGTFGVANNIFTGKVTINAGALDWFGAGSMPTPVAVVPDFITINSGGKFQLTYPDAPTTVSANVGFNVSGNAGIVTAGSHTIAGVIANGASAGGVTKTGNGTLTLSNANTYTGATAVNDGTLSLTGTLSGTSITVNGASAVFTQAGASVIAGTGSSFTVNGGTATLPGANTFTGAVTVADGTLITNNWNNVNTDGPLGNSALPVTLGGASTLGTLRYTGPGFLPDSGKKGLSLSAGGGIVQLALTGQAYVHLDGSSITGSGGLTLQTGGARFIVVESAAYTGPTLVDAGSHLQTNYSGLGDGTPFGAGTNGLGSAVTLAAGSILTFYSYNAPSGPVAIGSLSGVGTVRGEGNGTHIFKLGGDGTSTAFSGVIQDNGDPVGITKVGTGTQTLSGVNTYTGTTLVTAGTLLVSGSISGSTVTVDGGTLGGSGGTVGATTVNSGGTFAPGASIGTLNVSGTLALGGTAAFELNKTGFTLTSDLAAVSGALTLGGILNVTATGNTLTPGDSFNLFDAASFSGSFATLNLPSLTLDYTWDTSALSTDGSIAVVPEPGAAISLLSGLGILAAFRRRRA